MTKNLLIIFIFFWVLPFTVLAQEDRYQFSHLNIENGLSNNRVICIYKDAKGFMWFGTKSGLNRYDGYKFKVFKHDINNQWSINDDYIESITTGPNHKLWIKNRKGFDIYDPVTDRFDHRIKAALQHFAITDSLITMLTQDRFGDFWFMHSTRGLYCYNTKTNKSLHLQHLKNDTTSVHAGIGSGMASDSDGNLWVIYNDGILEKISYATHKVVYRINTISKAYPGEVIDYNLAIDNQNDIWAFTGLRANGVFYVSPAKNRCIQLGRDVGSVKISSNIVFNVIQDDKGLIWITTDHGGINLLDKKTFKSKEITSRPDDNKSLSQDCVISAYKDNANIIWLGTFKEGINYYHPDIIKFPLFRHESSISNSLSYNDINRFLEDKKGNIWIGSNGGGLIYFNRQSNTFITYKHNADPGSISNNVIASFCLDHTGKLWIGTYFGGLDCFDGKTFIHYKHSAKDNTTISDNSIWELMEDSKNRLWVGTLFGGLNMFDRQKKVFIHYPPGLPNSVPNPYVSGLLEDDKGNIWVATYNGLAVLQNNSNKFIYYKHSETDKGSLINNNISNLMMDSRKLIWIATNEGLSMYNSQTGKFKNFRQIDGLPCNAVLTVVEDNNHNLWMGTPNGLSNMIITNQAGKLHFEFKNYDQTDGLQGSEFNEDAALKTTKGELLFAGPNGFNLFRPEDIKSAKEKPVLVLTDFQLFNKSIYAGEKINHHIILTHSITETKEITLNNDENVFSIEYAAVNFFNPAKIKHAYKLEGFDKNWVTANEKVRNASYTNLDPGSYVFRLKVAGEDGKWNKNEIALKITVLPPIWRTPIAYLLYTILFIGFLFYLRYRGIKKLKANFLLEQERQEAQRMHELDLMKIKFFTNVSHEFRTPLSLILAPLENLLHKSTDDLHNPLQMISRNAKRLLNLVNQLLDFKKMEENELKINSRKGDIIEFIEETAYSFSDIAENKGIALSFYKQINSLIINFDHDKIERVLFNLLSNAFKFTPDGGKVQVKLSLEDKQDINKILRIEIIDNGIGIPESKREKIFDRFFQNEIPGSIVNQGSGIGLAITKEFVLLHNGTITVECAPGKGSNFIILLPVSPEHILEVTDKNIIISNDTALFEDVILDLNTNIKIEQLVTGAKKPVILIVEDSEDFRFYLKDNLKQYFNILEARNGLDGWQKALSGHPNLIVSDITMPEMNGIELCHKVKTDSRTSHIPLILLTALTGNDSQLLGFETGASDYLTKPFNFEILLSRIKNLLSLQNSLKKTYQKQLDINSSFVSPCINDEKFMKDILMLIEQKMADPNYSVEELSSDMAMSRVTLYRKVLQMTERTPLEFIKLMRLKKSAQFLEKSQLNIGEIAYKVGFNNPKYFAKSFKLEFDKLPSDYRNDIQQKSHEMIVLDS